MELTPEQQTVFDALLPAEKLIVEKMDFAGKQLYLNAKISVQPTPQTAGASTGVGVPNYLPGNQVSDTTYFQEALGVSGGRQVTKETGQPVAGTYTGFKSAFTPQTTPQGATSRLPSMRSALPRYFEGDEDSINNFKREQVASIQQQMKNAGILGKYKLGVVDNATLAAWKTVLGQANRTGGDWREGLQELSVGGSGGSGLTARVSSPDDLNKIIEQSAKYVLGRSIDPAMSQRISKAYQQLQIEEQRANKMGGVQVQAPQADVFAEKQIEAASGAEADAYKFAQFAKEILGGQGG